MTNRVINKEWTITNNGDQQGMDNNKQGNQQGLNNNKQW